MSGRTPDRLKAWEFITTFRDHNSSRSSLPEYFVKHGYNVLGSGKTFHPGLPAYADQLRSWTSGYCYPESKDPDPNQACPFPQDPSVASRCKNMSKHWMHGGVPNYTTAENVGKCPGWFAVPDGDPCEANLQDGPIAQAGVRQIAFGAKDYADSGRPFFVGVGYHKPHVQWMVPQRFFDMVRAICPRLARPALPMERDCRDRC